MLNIERATNNYVDDYHTTYRSQVRSVIARWRIEAVNNQRLEDGRSLANENKRNVGAAITVYGVPAEKERRHKLTNETAQETNTRALQ